MRISNLLYKKDRHIKFLSLGEALVRAQVKMSLRPSVSQ